MEREQERDKKTMNESESDRGQETQTSRAAPKSPIHESITQSNKEPISGKRNENSRGKVESSTSMGENSVSNMSIKSAKLEQSVDGETHDTNRAKLSVSKKSSHSPESEKNETSSMDSQSDHANEETSKADKKSLRKGKWAVEEEEYTSRVIQHFSAGLLTLPEGATLRSYLAEKLNCDPMRITKKFTGACCLGRRVYHLRDRPRASPTELEIAKAERDHLEQRFRMRIEHEQSGLPLNRRLDVLVAQPPGNVSTLFPNQNFTGANTLSPWVQNFATGQVDPFAFQRNLKQCILPLGQSHLPVLSNPAQHNQSRWLFPGAGESVVGSSTPPDPSLQLLSHLVTSWAVAQAAASLPPAALATLATGSIPVASAVPIANTRPHHQAPGPVADAQHSQPQIDIHRQLRNAYEEQKKEEEQRQLRAAFEEEKRKEEAKNAAAMVAKKNAAAAATSAQDPSRNDEVATIKNQDVSPAELLQKSYEAHLQALKTKENPKEGSHIPSPPKPSPKISTDECHYSVSSEVTRPVSNTSKADNGGSENEQPMPDEEAGTVLLGFLNSLRQSFEDAVEKKSIGDREVATNKSGSTSRLESSKPSSSIPTSIMKGRRVDWKKKGTKRSPERISVDNGQADTMNTLSTAVSQFISAKGGRRPPSVTDVSSGNSSTQHGEFSSSLEDSSDKTDPSSSEESEKEDLTRKRWQSKGPPRKRVKSFTEKNLIEHSKRMNESGN